MKVDGVVLTRGAAFVLAVFLSGTFCAAIGQHSAGEPLEATLRKIYAGSTSEVRYFEGYADLKGDGRNEAIIHVVGPAECGTGGCDTLIFTPERGGYRLVATIGLTRPPIVVTKATSHRWRNLVVFVSGGGIVPGYNAQLRFNGRTYPENPTDVTVPRVRGRTSGSVVIDSFKNFTQGKLLIPSPLKQPTK